MGGSIGGGTRHRLAAAIILVCALALTACEDDAAQQPAAAAPPPAVTVAAATQEPILTAYEFVGRAEAIEHVDLRARVPGFLIERAFVEGTDVPEGELLFVIEPDPYEAAVARARAELQSAQARVPQTQNALDRARQLFERGNIAASALDEAVAAAAQAEAEVAAAEAALREAEINLGYTRIEAPIAGRTGRARFSEGNLVGPDSGVLASVTALDPIYVTFNVSERDLIEFRRLRAEGGPAVGDIELRLRLPDDSDYDQTGRIDFVSPEVDPNTGTVPIRGVFPNPDALLLPGQFVTVVARAGEPELALVVPQAAVQQDQAGAFVLTVDEAQTVQTRRITTGTQAGTDWVVESGLDRGDRVIVQGLQRVRPGMRVDPTEAVPAAEG